MQLRRLAIAHTLVGLHLITAVAEFFSGENRYILHWRRTDALAVVVLGGALAVVAAWLYERTSEASRARKLADLAAATLLVSGILAGAVPQLTRSLWVDQATWLLLIVGLVVVFRRWPARLKALTRTTALMLAPLPVALYAIALSWPSIAADPPPRGADEAAAPAGAASRPPVLLIIPDSLSYTRIVEPDRTTVRRDLAGFRRLAERAVHFVDARSPDLNTMQSLPRILYQTEGRYLPTRPPRFRLESGVEAVPGRKSLLAKARRAGYETRLLGFYHPYAELLGAAAGDVASVPYYSKGIGPPWIGRPLWWSIRAGKHATDPVSLRLFQRLETVVEGRYSYTSRRRQTERALERVAALETGGTLLILHLGAPHHPYVFAPDGTWRRSGIWDRFGNEEGYEKNLAYVDRAVERMLEALEANGLLDPSLIVLTSDHAWHSDPRLPREVDEAKQWVPLLVKLPGQQGPAVEASRVYTDRMEAFWDAVFSLGWQDWKEDRVRSLLAIDEERGW